MHKKQKPQNVNRRRPARSVQRKPQRDVRVRPVESADSFTVKLRYPIEGTMTAAATSVAKRWKPNDAYDVDPVLGSTSTPMFAEYSAIYTYYRVTHYKVQVKVSNLDNLGISLYSTNSNTDPGTTGTFYSGYAQSPFGKTYELAPFYSGNGSVTIRHSVSVQKLVGQRIMQDSTFRALVSASPADQVWWGMGIKSNAGTNFANGVSYTGFIEMNVVFFSRQTNYTLYKLKRPSGIEWEANRQVYKLKNYKEPTEEDDKELQKLQDQCKMLVNLKMTEVV